MRRGFVSLVVVWVVALAAGPAGARTPALRYKLAFTGSVTVTHSDQGLQANGSACGLGTPDDTSPFDDHYTLSLRWRESFAVKLGARRTTVRTPARVSNGQFSYGGYAWSFSCDEIVYGPGGQPCTGVLADGGRAQLTVSGSPARRPKRLTLVAQPFATLTGTPSSCTVGAAPQITYMAADELGLASLGQTVTHTFKVPARKKSRTYKFKLRQTDNCSLPPQSAGESDTCSTLYTGSGSLQIRPG